jgi:quercetin dioxygenase-like cupin family protein
MDVQRGDFVDARHHPRGTLTEEETAYITETMSQEQRKAVLANQQINKSTNSSITIEVTMVDKSVKKVSSEYSPKGEMGQKYLVSGKSLSMRLWEEPAGEPKPPTERPYETVGYVIKGRAELQIEGQTILLEAGDSWVVPKGSSHSYTIFEPLTAVEATSPPAQVHGRDES